MKRVWGVVFGFVALAGAGSAAVSACAHDDTTIFVREVIAPPLVSSGQSCVFTPDPTQLFLSSGTLDVLLRSDYYATFLVGNQIVPRGDPTTPNTETSYVGLQGAEVRIFDSMGKQLRTFTRLASATINPAQGSNPSYTPIGVTIIDQQTAAGLNLAFHASRRLVVFVKFFGQTLGGQYVESNDFEFPVDVCAGCLIGFAPADINPACDAPNCMGNPGMMAQAPPVSCVPGQDFVLDCQYCKAAGIPECNPVVRCPGLDGGGGGGG